MKHLFLLIGLLMMVTPVHSGQYAIQIKSVKASQKEYFDVLSIYGSVYTVKDNDGNNNTHIGPIYSHQNAIDILHEIRVAGFDNATIIDQSKTVVAGQRQLSSQYNVKQYDVNTILEGESLKRWQQLSVTEKANIEYHRGELKIKNGDTRIPLDEYLSSKR